MSRTARIDLINIALMGVSLAVAFALPFQLVLLSYALLGPLHYLTEISWLHDRSYFTRRSWDFAVLAGLAAVIVGGSFALEALSAGLDDPAQRGAWIRTWQHACADLTMLAVGWAILCAATREVRARVVGSAAVIGLWILFNASGLSRQSSYLLLFYVFLPTVIHISVLTGAFILHGALRAQSVTGYLSFVVFAACTLACAWLPAAVPATSEGVRASYLDGFRPLNEGVAHLFGHRFAGTDAFFREPFFAALARFLAFAYTYHYLNWFSKTEIIGWHEVSARRIAWIAALWVAAVAVYVVDFGLGFRVLLLLSMLHVFLELPLNWGSFVGIGQQLERRLTRTA